MPQEFVLNRTLLRIMLAGVLALTALFAVAMLRYSGKPPVKLQARDCDSDLWKHVYRPGRLHVSEECTTVEGRVSSVHRASDGDLHIGLDPEQASVLNLVNRMHGRGQLVVEIVCEHSPKDAIESAACQGFTPHVTVPAVGDRIRVTGAYVTDRENGWNEVHPVTRIEVLQQGR